jgi:penicillin G amidase
MVRPWRRGFPLTFLVLLALSLALPGCGDHKKKLGEACTQDDQCESDNCFEGFCRARTTTDLPGDVGLDPGIDVQDDNGPRPDVPVDPGTDEAPPADVLADVPVVAKCLSEVAAGKQYPIPGLKGPVEIVRDQWGIPHIYAADEDDLFAAQGFATAMDRIIQMHGMRLVTQGTFAATKVGGPGDLSSDVYMRVVNLRGTAQKIWTVVQADEPDLKRVLEDFARGVNAYIDAVKAKKIAAPLEWDYLGQWEPWTPVDSLTIGRLQSWDLSFDGITDEVTMATSLQALAEKFPEGPLALLGEDVFRSAPATDATILPLPVTTRRPVVRKPAVPASTRAPASRQALAAYPAGYFAHVARVLAQVPQRPGAIALGGGSNNWAVAGAHTGYGKALLANDPHLSLRNPSVFYQVHLDTVRAGGDLALAGVSFPGIPGIILGHNARAAWAATVHYYDVTDVYRESLSPTDPPTVTFQDGQVPLEVRQEAFHYAKPAEGCESFLNDFVKSLHYTVAEDGAGCVVTVDIEVVPHHGPLIPGSKMVDGEGNRFALSWRWTGFEPSLELKAVANLWRVKTPAEFKAALVDFKVGAQNWLYADVDGHIAWAPLARVPVRGNTPEGAPTDYPPWLPMPGDGSCEWIGDVPLDRLPQVTDPAEGFIITANNDGFGYTVDNDPLNDGLYLSQAYDLGFRAARIRERLTGLLANDGLVRVEDMQAIQGDHQSPLGRHLVPGILAAVAAAKEGGVENPLNALLTPEVLAAADMLGTWGFEATSGYEPHAGGPERDSAIATSIFNAWLVELVRAIGTDKGLVDHPDQFLAKMLVKLFESPDSLSTWDPERGDSAIWDDTTTEAVETRNEVILKALGAALAFLSDPAAVGPSQHGGFGTDDVSKWLWGGLHTLTLPHALGGEANIPPESQWPDGYPRHGDNFVVDASNPGLSDMDFTYHSGASQRPVYLLQEGIPMQNALPGGQSGAFPNAHYRDDFALYADNQTHPVPFVEADVVEAAEACTLLTVPAE